MKFLSLIMILLAPKIFAKSYVMPSPFLSPKVEARLNNEQPWVRLAVSGEHFYGARKPEKPVIVELNRLTAIEDIEFLISTGVKNNGPYVNVLNASLVKGEKKYSFPVTATNFVSSYGQASIDISFKLKRACEALECDFEKGELVYLYIDYKGFREIAPIYEWDTMYGAYYLFRYK